MEPFWLADSVGVGGGYRSSELSATSHASMILTEARCGVSCLALDTAVVKSGAKSACSFMPCQVTLSVLVQVPKSAPTRELKLMHARAGNLLSTILFVAESTLNHCRTFC